MHIEEDQSCKMTNKEETIDLPPGFRFHPTDEEIISHYLVPKVMNSTFTAIAVAEVDLNKCEPWDLPMKEQEKESYFFCQRDRKYPTGTRTNRATESGYWKATGKDKEIFKGKSRRLVGMKKTLVFYTGRAPKGEKTNWVMHEFRLDGQFSYYTLPKLSKEEWVVSRVFHKSNGIKKDPFMIQGDHDHSELSMRINSFVDDLLNCSSSSPPPLVDPTRPTSSSFCTDNYMSGFDEDDDGEFNFLLNNRTMYDHHHAAYDQKPLIYNHTLNPNPNPIPNPFWLEGQLKVEQFSSNQDSIDAFINNITNFADLSSSQLQNNPNHNMGMSSEIPDMEDIDCLWDF